MLGRWLLLLVGLSLVAGGASALSRVSQASSPVAEAEGLRDELREIRGQLEVCLATQDRIELRFQALTRDTDRLRSDLDALEELDPRGVPAERYDDYLELVEAFNRSIPEWERQAESLRQHESSCRDLMALHNRHADSLQRFLVDAGIWDAAWLEAWTATAESPPDPPEEEPGATTP